MKICQPLVQISDKKFSIYCTDLPLTSYHKVPYGAEITPAEVINIYAKQKGIRCSVAESDIFTDSEYMYVTFKGDDYMLFKFAPDNDAGSVTDVLCLLVGRLQVYYTGYPTMCEIYEQSCNKIKELVGDKVRVEFNSDTVKCEIVEWGPEVYMGEIHFGN